MGPTGTQAAIEKGGRMGHWAGRDRLVTGLPSWDVPAREQPSPVFQIPSSESTGTELFIAGEELCSVSGGAHPVQESKSPLERSPPRSGAPPCPGLLSSPQLLLPPQPFTLFLIFKIVVKDAYGKIYHF